MGLSKTKTPFLAKSRRPKGRGGEFCFSKAVQSQTTISRKAVALKGEGGILLFQSCTKPNNHFSFPSGEKWFFEFPKRKGAGGQHTNPYSTLERTKSQCVSRANNICFLRSALPRLGGLAARSHAAFRRLSDCTATPQVSEQAVSGHDAKRRGRDSLRLPRR